METHPIQDIQNIFCQLSQNYQKDFEKQRNILSYSEFLQLVYENPKKMLRNAAEYIRDMILSYGIEEEDLGYGEKRIHYKIFETSRVRGRPPIVGQEEAHGRILEIIEQFVRQGKVDKLILLHGPNGSSKSSTAIALAEALEHYSQTDEGAIYRFNWVFPTEKIDSEDIEEITGNKKIGFGKDKASKRVQSFAHLSDDEIMCKIVSEVKENPIFLLPLPQRKEFFMHAWEKAYGRKPLPEEIPLHLETGGLSPKSKKIFDALLIAYNGNLEKVLAHVQVERFFFSARYQIGIARVEPQMHIDAQEKQLTLDRSVQNLPVVLQNIRIFEPSGELIDANRGFIEFSDLLKRPLETFKYLLTTIETMNVNLSSGIIDLDLLMIASTNEKHLDAFKTIPDWASFKGRFELVRIPYLLKLKDEEKIYCEDVNIITKSKPFGPHALELLVRWAILTRLKHPQLDFYTDEEKALVAKVTPTLKLMLYNYEELPDSLDQETQKKLRKLTEKIRKDGQNGAFYEGRFGVSPREIKSILYFAAQHPHRDSVTALGIFEEIEQLISDRSVYEFLQFEVQNGYHDAHAFLNYCKDLYAKTFYQEFLQATEIYNENQYEKAFEKYLQHVAAYLKKEKIYNEITHRNEDPDESLMTEFEKLVNIQEDKNTFRQNIISKMASWKVDNPNEKINIKKIYNQEFQTISKNIYEKHKKEIKQISESMIMYGTEDYQKLPQKILEVCENTYNKLENKFGYTRKNTWESLVFISKKIINNS